jgi:hypothetical protein
MGRLSWAGVGLCAATGVGALGQWLCGLGRFEARVPEHRQLEAARELEESGARDGTDARRMDAASGLETELGEQERVSIPTEAWSACLEAALPEIFRDELREATGEWLPSRESLRYWTLENAVEQIDQLSLECVAGLIGPDDDYSDFVAAQLDAPDLRTALPFPTDADVDRLWWNSGTRRLFEEALRFKHYIGIVEHTCEYRLGQLKKRCASSQQYSCVWETDPALRELDELRSRLEASESAAWEALWESDRNAYPHWSFLMRVAGRRFL